MPEHENPTQASGDAAPYNALARRDTPLAEKLKAQIAQSGPISVRAYMDACLNDPEHGYYRGQAAIGQAGDFITAPEVSQIFGELIGLWCAVVWQQFGAPKRFNLIELGPGRGTLMRDGLRAARALPGVVDAADVWLIESNPVLREIQRGVLEGSGVAPTWLDRLEVGDGEAGEARTKTAVAFAPTILIANEFLDVRPVSQFVRDGSSWCERMVTIDAGGQLCYANGAEPDSALPDLVRTASDVAEGTIIEIAAPLDEFLKPLVKIAGQQPLVMLFIDYGHAASGPGETLQAVRGHRYEHPLTSPGEADLSALVDFLAFLKAMQASGFATAGPVPQGEFLGRLGIIERASRLMAQNPAQAAQIEASVARLTSPQGMGSRFLAAAVFSPGLVVPPGLPQPGTPNRGAGQSG